MTEATLELHGRQVRCSLDGDKLSFDGRELELAQIARVRLATLAETSICELSLRDGTTRVIANDARASRAAYAALIRELHARLAAHDSVEYVRGAWLLVGTMAGIGVLVIAIAAVLWAGWIAVPANLASRAALVMILGVAWLVVGPLLVWRSRPHAYDPRALPADLVE